MVMGAGFPPFRGGPFRFVDQVGAKEVLGRLRELEKRYGPRFSPAPVLEEIAEALEILEQEDLSSPDQETVSRIYGVKRRLLGLRRTISPHREALNALIRDAGGQIT